MSNYLPPTVDDLAADLGKKFTPWNPKAPQPKSEAPATTLPSELPKRGKGRSYTPKEDRAIERIRKCQTKDYYKLLNVKDTATAGKITAQYRKLALLTHPDKNKYPDAEDCFKCESWSVHWANYYEC